MGLGRRCDDLDHLNWSTLIWAQPKDGDDLGRHSSGALMTCFIGQSLASQYHTFCPLYEPERNTPSRIYILGASPFKSAVLVIEHWKTVLNTSSEPIVTGTDKSILLFTPCLFALGTDALIVCSMFSGPDVAFGDDPEPIISRWKQRVARQNTRLLLGSRPQLSPELH